jgi:protein TonB
MVFQEALDAMRPDAHYALQIFATDLDADAIQIARAGSPLAAASPLAFEAPPPSGRLPALLALSVGLHAALATALVALPTAPVTGSPPPVTLEFEVSAVAPAPPAPVEAPVAPPPTEATPVPEIVRTTPRASAPVAEPVAPVAPPSLDEVFAEPAAALPSLSAEAGAFAVTAGASDGVAGGVAGGHGAGATEASSTGAAEASPAGPSPDAVRRARRAYVQRLGDLLRAAARYPLAARRERRTGRVELALRVSADGVLTGVRVVGASGHPVLDDAALETARSLGSLPAPPSLVPWDAQAEVRTSLVYELN